MAIKIKILNILCILFGVMLSASLYAQGDFASPEQVRKLSNKSKPSSRSKSSSKKKPAPKSKRRDAGQSALVKVDGSAVYEVPNFDSPVLEYMDRGKNVKISKKIYPGIGGLGAFYKIRVKKGVYGFIADTDADVSGKKLADKDDDYDEEDQKLEEGSDPTQLQSAMYGASDESEEAAMDTFYLTRYMGLTYAAYNFSEVLRNKTEVAQTTMLGAKISGPTGVMSGMPLDINLLFTTTAPTYYSKISNSTSGFMLISDALVTVPLYESKSVLLYYGFGAVLRYSSWQVKLKSQTGAPPIDSQELGLGVAATGGAALRLGARLAVRGDARYYYEKEKYFGYGVALQFKY